MTLRLILQMRLAVCSEKKTEHAKTCLVLLGVDAQDGATPAHLITRRLLLQRLLRSNVFDGTLGRRLCSAPSKRSDQRDNSKKTNRHLGLLGSAIPPRQNISCIISAAFATTANARGFPLGCADRLSSAQLGS